jgi:hypothetical protein
VTIADKRGFGRGLAELHPASAPANLFPTERFEGVKGLFEQQKRGLGRMLALGFVLLRFFVGGIADFAFTDSE